jgi:hypothetical protein
MFPRAHGCPPKEQFPWKATMFPQGENVFETLCDHNLLHLNSNWNVFNYKVVVLFQTFPMISHKIIYKQIEDDYDC